MNTVVPFNHNNGLPRQLTADRCVEWVRELVFEGGKVQFTNHAYDRMEQRDVSATQVFRVLRRGELVVGPTWSAEYENWMFTMKADTAGQAVSVGATIEVDPVFGVGVLVLTVIA